VISVLTPPRSDLLSGRSARAAVSQAGCCGAV